MGAPHASRSIVSLLLATVLLSMGCEPEAPPLPTPASRFPPASTFANRCDDAVASKQWVRSTLDTLYLWADDVVDVDPVAAPTPEAYFQALLVRTPTPSGRPRNRYSTPYPASYFHDPPPLWHGVRWSIHDTDARALYVRSQTPAALAGVRRGDRVVAVGGTPVETLGAAALSAALAPPPGTGPLQLTLVDPAGGTRSVTLDPVTFIDPGVLATSVLDRPLGKVGYVAFTSQLGDPVGDMASAVRRLSAAGVTDLVLDVRYNPGGIAPVVAAFGTLIAGDHVGSNVFAFFTRNPRTQQARLAAGQPGEEVILLPGRHRHAHPLAAPTLRSDHRDHLLCSREPDQRAPAVHPGRANRNDDLREALRFRPAGELRDHLRPHRRTRIERPAPGRLRRRPATRLRGRG